MAIIGFKGRKKLRFLIGNLKDKTSLIKSSLLLSKRTSKVRVLVIRATTRHHSSAPSEEYVDTLLSSGRGSRAIASACIESIMDRLHKTRNVYVALKCLVILHKILLQGSFILKDQLSIYPTYGGRNFLNLSSFRDESDRDTWEMSNWVRWHAGLLEKHLIVSRAMVFMSDQTNKEDLISGLPNSGLVNELESLTGFVERVSESPTSYHYQKYDLVHDVVRLSADNYGMIQREIWIRVKEMDNRIDGFDEGELTQSINVLQQLENCRGRLVMLFLNRRRNHDLWDLIGEIKSKLASEKTNRDARKIVKRVDSVRKTGFRFGLGYR